MYEAVHSALPADGAFFTAAVADWKVIKTKNQKLKKQNGMFQLLIYRNRRYFSICLKAEKNRPKMVIGFAAETENILINAKSKLKKRL